MTEQEWDWKEFQEASLQIDFLESDIVTKIYEFVSQLDDVDIRSLCESYFSAEDGQESIDLFEEVIEAYHDLLRD